MRYRAPTRASRPEPRGQGLRHPWTAVALATLMVAGVGCSDAMDWAIRDCSAAELAFIDTGIARAAAVAPEAGATLAERYPEEPADYDEILERLRGARERGNIRCGDPAYLTDPDASTAGGTTSRGYTNTATGQVVLNTGAMSWRDAISAHEEAAWYGDLTVQATEKHLVDADWGEFRELKAAARDWIFAPTTAAEILIHEAAHLATASRYPHALDVAEEDLTGTDFVFEAGHVTRAAIYWELWQPERQRLDALYFDR